MAHIRTDIDDRREEIERWIECGKTLGWICAQLRCKYETIKPRLVKWGINYKNRQDWSRGKRFPGRWLSAEEYLRRVNSGETVPKSHKIKQVLIRDGVREERCEYCGRSEWMGMKIPLELHHVDCNRFNNKLKNLAIMCPNCHAQQPGNSGANQGSYAGMV